MAIINGSDLVNDTLNGGGLNDLISEPDRKIS
jgi:hypothetical protein